MQRCYECKKRYFVPSSPWKDQWGELQHTILCCRCAREQLERIRGLEINQAERYQERLI